MSVQMINSNIKTGCCPHGLPLGACPICSGMSGSSTKPTQTVTKKSDEWSYAKCYAFWQRMLAKEAQQKADNQAQVAFRADVLIFQKNVKNLIVKLDNALISMQKSLPQPIAKTINVISQKILMPILRMIKKLPDNIEKVTKEIQKFVADISDKLVAIFGELKKSVEKRLQKNLKTLKKSIFMLLAVFDIDYRERERAKCEGRVSRPEGTFNAREQDSASERSARGGFPDPKARLTRVSKT